MDEFLTETRWMSFCGSNAIAVAGNCCHLQWLKHQTQTAWLWSENAFLSTVGLQWEAVKHTRYHWKNLNMEPEITWGSSLLVSEQLTLLAFSCGREDYTRVTYRFEPKSCLSGEFQSLGMNSQSVSASIPNQGVRQWKPILPLDLEMMVLCLE